MQMGATNTGIWTLDFGLWTLDFFYGLGLTQPGLQTGPLSITHYSKFLKKRIKKDISIKLSDNERIGDVDAADTDLSSVAPRCPDIGCYCHNPQLSQQERRQP